MSLLYFWQNFGRIVLTNNVVNKKKTCIDRGEEKKSLTHLSLTQIEVVQVQEELREGIEFRDEFFDVSSIEHSLPSGGNRVKLTISTIELSAL